MSNVERSDNLEQQKPSHLPIVTSEVKDRIIEDMGGVDPNPVPYLDTFSENVFADVSGSNRNFAQAINELLIERTANVNPGIVHLKQNAYITGMALVLKAFDYVKEFDLLPRFANLKPDDIALAKQTLENSLPQKHAQISILQRLLSMPRIPEQQISLNECVNAAKRGTFPTDQRALVDGAAAMYKTMEVLWPKLYPSQTTPPQQPTTQ